VMSDYRAEAAASLGGDRWLALSDAHARLYRDGDCASCPLRPRCTTAKDGQSMTIHPHEDLLRAARAQARTEAFRKARPTRSAIERTIAWTATQNGRSPDRR